MLGRTASRNAVVPMVDFPVEKLDLRSVLWKTPLGSNTYGSPIIADGNVLVGTNNGAGYLKHFPIDQDFSVLLCFAESNGEFRWQYTSKKLKGGRAVDVPRTGMVSTPCVSGKSVFIVTNRAEIVCLDLDGFVDGINDGPFKDEKFKTRKDADIIWKIDLVKKFGVVPHRQATCSPVVHKDNLFVITGHGNTSKSKQTPSFVCLDKKTGAINWIDSSPILGTMRGQWSSPAICRIRGRSQVIFSGGDGFVYAFDADKKERDLIWKADCNLKKTAWKPFGLGLKNNILSTPVCANSSVYITMGRDPSDENGPGQIHRIIASGKGDVSRELGPIGKPGKRNSNSSFVWSFGEPKTLKKKPEKFTISRSVSSVIVLNGLVFAADLYGIVYCIDSESGKLVWSFDTEGAIFASPINVGNHVLFCNETGELFAFEVSRTKKLASRKLLPTSIYSTPAFANGNLFVCLRDELLVLQLDE